MSRSEESLKKRKANSPINKRGKERRKEDMSDAHDINNQSSVGLKNSKNESSAVFQHSYLTVGGQGLTDNSKPIRKPIFTTQKPDGAFRDEIVVEIKTLDDKPFYETITPKEARRTIFEGILGFKQEDLNGFYFAYSGCPIVTFKLKEQFNINSLESFQELEFKRKYKVHNAEKTASFKCKIRGIHSRQNNQAYNYHDEGFRRVKVEGCEYRLKEKQILNWLSYFSEVLSEISEDTHKDDSSDDLPPVGNGIYSVQMKLKRDMPQLIPMHGKKIRLYYRGIIKRCTNCFGTHRRKDCKEEKVPWMKYVQQFINNYPEIPKESYGRWATMIDGTRPERDADKTIVTVQLTQSTSTGAQPKITKPTMQTTKPTTQTTKENDSEMGKEDEQETAREKKSKTVEESEQEELCQAIQSLVASGMSIKAIEEFFLSEKTETKNRLRGLKLGGGRGRGRGRGKCRST
jgi:hypothetical protein